MISNGDFDQMRDACTEKTNALLHWSTGVEIGRWSVTLNGMVYGKIIFRH